MTTGSRIQKIIPSILHRWWLLAPAILLFGFIVFKAATAALTWDEAHSFFEYVRCPTLLTRNYNFMAANNHLLNTWAMKVSIRLFGESELALRLPNVLAGGLYFLALSRLLLRFIDSRLMSFAGFLLLSCNPYMLDFFSLARGYGLSIALLMCGIYYSAIFIAENHAVRKAVIALLFFALATLACLTCVHLLFAAAFLFAALLFLSKENARWKKNLLLFAVPVIFLAILLPYVIKLQQHNAFYLGKEANSPLALVASLADATAYTPGFVYRLSPWLVRFFYIIPVLGLVEIFHRRKTLLHGTNGVLLFLLGLLVLAFLSPIVQHYVMGSNFISGRAALFFLPLLFLLLLFAAYEAGKPAHYAFVVIAALSLAHFSFSVNKKSFFDYAEQADVKDAIQLLKAKKIPVVNQSFANVLTSDLPYEEQINYYRMRLDLQNFGHCARNEAVPPCSWFYLPADDTTRYGPCEVLRYFPATKTALFRVKDPPQLHYVTEVWQDFEHEDPYMELRTDTIFLGEKGTFANADHPFSIGIPFNIPDTLTGRLAVTLNCRLNYSTRNTAALLVFQFSPGSEETWNGMYITELSTRPGEWSITGWTRPVPPGAKKVRVFLWSQDKTDVLMDNVALRLLRY